MNTADKDNTQDDASRHNQEASSSSSSSNNSNSNSGEIQQAHQQNNHQPHDYDTTMKRAAARRLIERYFYQLTDGCGNPACDNEHCASSGEVKNLTPDQAAAQALQLFFQDARLCDRHPNKVARTHNNKSALPENECNHNQQQLKKDQLLSGSGAAETSCYKLETKELAACTFDNNTAILNTTTNNKTDCMPMAKSRKELKSIPYLTEHRLREIIKETKETNCYSYLIHTLFDVFSQVDVLSKSFTCETLHSPIDAMLDKVPGDLTKLKKEDVRSMEGEQDKDHDSCVGESFSLSPSLSCEPTLDLKSLRRTYTELFQLPNTIPYESTLVNALTTLANYIQMELQIRSSNANFDDVINVLLIVFEIPTLGTGEYLEMALPALCKAAAWLPVRAQAQLARKWAGPGRPALRNILENLQQLITLTVIVTQFHRDFYVQDELVITSATKIMKIVYYANMMAGVMESAELRIDDHDGQDDNLLVLGGAYGSAKFNRGPIYEDPLGAELQINALDCRAPYLPFSEFYNEPLSDAIEMDRDFTNYKGEITGAIGKFSFMNYAFVLTPATKSMGLYFDNRIRMYSERRNSFIQSVAGQLSNPYLRLRVRRDHIIDDALVELEMTALENPIDLKKQLVVEFVGEQGIDEGGVSKEFFQLIVEEIFNPDYGMFICQPDSQSVWFNPTSFESEAQFGLIGIVLGLAIYNYVILSVNFPMVVYRKLMGKKGSFEDLQDWNPTVYSSLKQMLEYNEPDLEDVFLQTFKVCHQDMFGNVLYHELKENGDQINVTQENKQEFVNLYADFLLNKSVDKQFRAFRRGFQMVTGESPLDLLFRPEEIELLVCGSKNFDFAELELATEYDGGYTTDSRIIKDFWSIVHSLAIEDQQKLLQFTTGSDRVPLGGLSKLKMVIARNGPDSDRLPTAHTCFNVLLLPEYSTKDKLRDRLVKAINYSKGFGML